MGFLSLLGGWLYEKYPLFTFITIIGVGKQACTRNRIESPVCEKKKLNKEFRTVVVPLFAFPLLTLSVPKHNIIYTGV